MKEQPRYPVYARGHRPPDEHSRVFIPIFASPEEARGFVDAFIGDDEWGMQGDRIVLPGSGMNLAFFDRTHLDRVMKAKPDPIDDQVLTYISRFKYGTWHERHERPVVEAKETLQVVRERRPGIPDGYVTITALCNAAGMPATEARAILRASGLTKPPYGWAFAPKEVPEIKSLIGIYPKSPFKLRGRGFPKRQNGVSA